jgi:hypothetical protein
MSAAQSSPLADDDPPMGRTYALVVVWHIAVMTFLWWFGRAFSV